MNRFVGLLLLLSCSVAVAEPVYTGFFSNTALSGYDSVAYFTLEKGADPVEGDSQFSVEYSGAEWYFATLENLKKFRQAPDKYAPQYGGYCAWVVSARHKLTGGDPYYWEIVNGKLYLNSDQTAKDIWDLNLTGHIKQANTNWSELARALPN